MGAPQIRIKSAILCEEVRAEVGGKHTLLGVFSGNINVSKFPASIRLAMYFELETSEEAVFTSKIRIKYGNKDPVVGDAEIRATEKTAALVTPMMNLSAEEEGDFVTEISFGDDQWQEVIRKHIAIGPVEQPYLQ